MSLVAYGASDDSEASDADDGEAIATVNQPKSDVVRSQTEGVGNNNNNVPSQTVITTKAVDSADISTPSKIGETLNGAIISDEEEPSDFLKALPAPKVKVSTSSVLDVTEDDELEDIVKPKPSQLADVVKPVKKQGKGRQPVKISIPSLSTDSDDEDGPKRKKLKSSTRGSGLTSLLPAPKNLSLKETNRILLPHALKKLPPPSASSRGKTTAKVAPKAPSAKPGLLVSGVPDSDSDEDGDSEAVSFFSLGEKADLPSTSALYSAERTSTGARTSLRLPPVSAGSDPLLTTAHTTTTMQSESFCGPQLPKDSSSTVPAQSQTLPGDKSSASSPGIYEKTGQSCASSQDFALSFKTQTDQDAPLSFKAGHTIQPHSVSYSYPQMHASHHGYMGDGDQQPYSETGEYYQENQASDVEKYLHDEEFLKLQGKKQRGREQVNFIDINTNEFTGTQDLMKTLTVEQEHTSHRKKDNQPSGRQRSKHQITYLAYQAKERELTLKNQWAQNRQTKQQTQSKYGF